MPLDLLEDLEARGLVHASTDRDALRSRLATGPIAVYYGCDPTRDSLHHGNLIGLLMLRRFQEAGHRPVALAGGATGMVGDPSGRSEERNLLDDETLERNLAAITAQITRILGDGGGWALVDNRTWTAHLRLLDFLRDVGKHVTVNQMVARESVKLRMASEHGISFTEFSYMLLQANDYLWLHRHEAVELQIGGSDQWGNILSGVDLVRRADAHAVHALCWPLLTSAGGIKVGKSTGAQLWLDPARTSTYAFYQHFVQVEDADLRRHLAWFTLLPVEKIDDLVRAHLAAPERRAGQRRLAFEVTSLVHGRDAAAAAEGAADMLFGGAPEEASVAALEMVEAEVPRVDVARRELEAGVDPARVLRDSGLVRSTSEGRRTVEQGGVAVNGSRLEVGMTIGTRHLLHGRWAVLRKGKRSFAVVRLAPDDGADAGGSGPHRPRGRL
ncbi:MAG: tyrosine--tRNA ligase [Actinobacteria bacterium]|nr:tyrosine--tRNA ligase [Actinomycetota bacterium]